MVFYDKIQNENFSLQPSLTYKLSDHKNQLYLCVCHIKFFVKDSERDFDKFFSRVFKRTSNKYWSPLAKRHDPTCYLF